MIRQLLETKSVVQDTVYLVIKNWDKEIERLGLGSAKGNREGCPPQNFCTTITLSIRIMPPRHSFPVLIPLDLICAILQPRAPFLACMLP